MKMENEICAPSDGKITGVNVRKGDSVETRALLCTMRKRVWRCRMFKKKNKNLHRALVALMVLGLLVCLCFTFASAASQPDSSSAAETAAVEDQGAQSNSEAMTNFLNQAGIATLIHNATGNRSS